MAHLDEFDRSEEAVFAKHGPVDYDDLTQEERDFVDIWWLRAECNNGGFNQYFDNSAGDHVQNAIDALGRIGAVRTQALMQEVCDLYFPDRLTRMEQVSKLPKDGDEPASDDDWVFLRKADSLHERFYNCDEPLEDLIVKYWNTS